MPASATAPRPAGQGSTISRAEILRAGQTTEPWVFIPLASDVLALQPADDDLRLLMVDHLVRLGLRTAAREHLSLLSSRAAADPRAGAAERAIEALADDRIPLAELDAACAANVETLARRPNHPVNLRLHLAVWRAQAERQEWFRALGGNIVRRERGTGGDRWLQMQDARAAAAAYARSVADRADNAACPVVIEGVDPPWLFQHVYAAHPRRDDGHRPSITLLQADPLELLDGLAQTDLRMELSDLGVQVLVGPRAASRLAGALSAPERLDYVVGALVVTTGGLRTRLEPHPAQVINEAGALQTTTRERLWGEIARRYAGRTPAWWAERYAHAGAAAPATPIPPTTPLRVLVITCRYSTFVKHAANDLADAFAGRGCSVRVLIEPDDTARLTPLATIRAVHEHHPDLVVMVNYTRRTMQGMLPEGLPVLTWVQDAMPHLLDPETGRAIGPLDFLTGNLYHEYFERHGYPPEQCLPATTVASGKKFHDGPISEERRQRFACDIAYVSHHSQTPEALHTLRVSQIRDDPRVVGALDRLYPLIEREVGNALAVSLTIHLRELTETVLRDSGVPADDGGISRLTHTYTLPVADRILRHRTLLWAADAARRNNWKLRLYGRGWEPHPTLAEFAHGEVGHDDDLRACYASAKAHLQVTAFRAVHQRVLECALSGGLPLMRLHEEDAIAMRYAAVLAAAKAGAADACNLELTGRYQSPSKGYRASNSPEGRRVNALLERMGCPTEEFLWIADGHLSRAAPFGGVVGTEYDHFWLLGDPGEIMFASEDQLEDRLRLAITDREWREATRATLVSRTREHLTHDALAGRLLDFIGTRLRASGARPTRGA